MKKNKQLIYCKFRLAFILLLAMVALLPAVSSAQQEKKPIYDGNNKYKSKQYNAAEKEYSKALNKNKDSYKGAFNLGDTYYKQGKYEEAANQFQQLTHRATSKDTLSKVYHNLGNSLLRSKKYQESIDAYKNALKNNPNDEDTRYNLSYAQQMLKKEEQQKQKENKDKKDNKDQNKDKKDKNKNKDDKDKKDKDKKDQDKKDQQKKDSNNKQNEISKEDAKRVLEALQNDEKNLHDNMKKGKEKGMKVKVEKDW